MESLLWKMLSLVLLQVFLGVQGKSCDLDDACAALTIIGRPKYMAEENRDVRLSCAYYNHCPKTDDGDEDCEAPTQLIGNVGEDLEFDSRVEFRHSGECKTTQTVRLMFLNKILDDKSQEQLFVCSNLGSLTTVPTCPNKTRVAVSYQGGDGKYDIKLSLQGLTLADSGNYQVKVEVEEYVGGKKKSIFKNFHVTIEDNAVQPTELPEDESNCSRDLLMVVTLRIDGDHQVMAHGDLKEQFILAGLVLTCISTFVIIFLCTYFIVIIQKYSSKFQKLTIPWNYSSWVREKRNPGCAVAFVSGESCTTSGPSHSDLMNYVAAALPTKWWIVGVQLGLSVSRLDEIERNHSNCKRCFSAVFSEWEQQETSPFCWETVVSVLQAPSVEENRVAKEVKTHFMRRQHNANSSHSFTGSSINNSSSGHFTETT